MLQIFQTAGKWLDMDDSICLAIVSKTWGSAPRRAGSLMIIHPEGHFEGSVSGGCVEGAVIAEASTLKEPHKTLTFAVSSDDAWEAGLACGGEITIELFKITPRQRDIIKAAENALNAREHAELIFCKVNGQHKIDRGDTSDRNPLLNTEQNTHLRLMPRNRMLIIGAVHIAQYLSPVAAACDYDVTIIDPRASFTENRTFEGAETITDWPDEYIRNHPLDRATAVITLTHDPKIDDAILRPALISKAFYIGALGSRKTHTDRLGRLKAAGYSPQALARINGPIGLNIGAATPAEIAVSIMAEVTETYRTGRAV